MSPESVLGVMHAHTQDCGGRTVGAGLWANEQSVSSELLLLTVGTL